jgi:hypothetical protein
MQVTLPCINLACVEGHVGHAMSCRRAYWGHVMTTCPEIGGAPLQCNWYIRQIFKRRSPSVRKSVACCSYKQYTAFVIQDLGWLHTQKLLAR